MTEPRTETATWQVDGVDVPYQIARIGTGPTALCLPALSSISTQAEMKPLQARLADRFTTIAVDWPGFGTADRPKVAWRPDHLSRFLNDVLTGVAPEPALIVAAGHAAGYVIRHFAEAGGVVPRLALVAPTWRGPFPTMVDKRPGWLTKVPAVMDAPGIGRGLYALNLSDVVVRRMARGHVYTDPSWMTPAWAQEKRRVTGALGARFASIRFVTGALDPFQTASAFHAAARAIPADRCTLIWGADTPRKSKAEMATLATTIGLTPVVLDRGKLGVHEEFPDWVADAIWAGPGGAAPYGIQSDQ